MLRSSLGFHTMTLSLFLLHKDVPQLIRDFKDYSKNTGLIQMYHVDKSGVHSRYQPTDNSTHYLPTNLKIFYYKEDIGIKWNIRYNNWSSDFQSYIVETTINPKILGGIPDYITAATYDDMEAAITNFNREAKRISSLLEDFDCYSLKRLDYCINFDLNELINGCNTEQIIELITRSNIPPHYEEWTEYDYTAHRKKSKPGSFYLINPSANINCYSKYMQLQNRSQENERMGYPPIPETIMNTAKGIIRFEVQCKYHKMYMLSDRAKKAGNCNYNKYESLLTHEACDEIINYYFKKTIGRGDWYTLQNAVRMIESYYFNKQKEKRLIDALHFVNQCRSLAKAKAAYKGSDLAAFKHTLKELRSLGINPVTIPKDWGVKHIPNLLYTYYDKINEERTKKEMQKFLKECFYEDLK